ncbi:MAG: methylated-DNA--[protein]-cysteine S-methyltransferase [Candidatus Thiodiazotropha sp. L084R]
MTHESNPDSIQITDLNSHQNNYTRIANAIEYIRSNSRKQPSLAEIAAAVHLSEHHLQRIFSEWAGISPKRFLQYITKEYARQALIDSKDLLSTSLESGLSGPGRLHDLMITCEAMSPGEIKQHGRGLTISYGIADSPFGDSLIAWTDRGICALSFCDQSCSEQEKGLAQTWPEATITCNAKAASKLLKQVFCNKPEPGKLHLLLRGTNFQVKVWEALLNIGTSRLISYSSLAQMAGSPKAQRAVGSALAENQIGYLIPCHRVIRGNGDTGIYRWGNDRKLAMLVWEAAKKESGNPVTK